MTTTAQPPGGEDPAHTEGEEMLTPAEAAALFGVHTHTLTVWAREGRIPPDAYVRTLGGHRRYRAARIRALLRKSERTDTP